jgi:hypothetical protein
MTRTAQKTTPPPILLQTVKVKVTLRLTVGQSVSPGVEPHLGLMTRYLLLFDSCGLVFMGRPLAFVYAAGPRKRSVSRVRVPRISRPYFTVSVLRLSFSSPPTTRRVTVEVFDPASTRVVLQTDPHTLRWYDTDRIENGVSNNYSIVACVFIDAVKVLPIRCLATIEDIYRRTDWWEGFMKYAVEIDSCSIMYIATIIKIDSIIQKLMGGDNTQTASWSHIPTFIFLKVG